MSLRVFNGYPQIPSLFASLSKTQVTLLGFAGAKCTPLVLQPMYCTLRVQFTGMPGKSHILKLAAYNMYENPNASWSEYRITEQLSRFGFAPRPTPLKEGKLMELEEFGITCTAMLLENYEMLEAQRNLNMINVANLAADLIRSGIVHGNLAAGYTKRIKNEKIDGFYPANFARSPQRTQYFLLNWEYASDQTREESMAEWNMFANTKALSGLVFLLPPDAIMRLILVKYNERYNDPNAPSADSAAFDTGPSAVPPPANNDDDNAAEMPYDPWAVLGIQRTATAEDITRAYVNAAKKLHPDKTRSAESNSGALEQIKYAKDVLSDPELLAMVNNNATRTALNDFIIERQNIRFQREAAEQTEREAKSEQAKKEQIERLRKIDEERAKEEEENRARFDKQRAAALERLAEQQAELKRVEALQAAESTAVPASQSEPLAETKAAVEDMIATTRAELRDLEDEVTTSRIKIERLDAERADIAKKLAESEAVLKRERSSLKHNIVIADRLREEYAKKRDEAEARMMESFRAMREARRLEKTAKESAAAVEAQKQATEKKLAETAEMAKSAMQALETGQAELSRRQSELAAVKAEVDAKQEAAKGIKMTAEQRDAETAELLRRLRDAEERRDAAQKSVTAKLAELADLQTQETIETQRLEQARQEAGEKAKAAAEITDKASKVVFSAESKFRETQITAEQLMARVKQTRDELDKNIRAQVAEIAAKAEATAANEEYAKKRLAEREAGIMSTIAKRREEWEKENRKSKLLAAYNKKEAESIVKESERELADAEAAAAKRIADAERVIQQAKDATNRTAVVFSADEPIGPIVAPVAPKPAPQPAPAVAPVSEPASIPGDDINLLVENAYEAKAEAERSVSDFEAVDRDLADAKDGGNDDEIEQLYAVWTVEADASGDALEKLRVAVNKLNRARFDKNPKKGGAWKEMPVARPVSGAPISETRQYIRDAVDQIEGNDAKRYPGGYGGGPGGSGGWDGGPGDNGSWSFRKRRNDGSVSDVINITINNNMAPTTTATKQPAEVKKHEELPEKKVLDLMKKGKIGQQPEERGPIETAGSFFDDMHFDPSGITEPSKGPGPVEASTEFFDDMHFNPETAGVKDTQTKAANLKKLKAAAKKEAAEKISEKTTYKSKALNKAKSKAAKWQQEAAKEEEPGVGSKIASAVGSATVSALKGAGGAIKSAWSYYVTAEDVNKMASADAILKKAAAKK